MILRESVIETTVFSPGDGNIDAAHKIIGNSRKADLVQFVDRRQHGCNAVMQHGDRNEINSGSK